MPSSKSAPSSSEGVARDKYSTQDRIRRQKESVSSSTSTRSGSRKSERKERVLSGTEKREAC